MDSKLPAIPTAKPDDPEDVSWALSTAEAMWSRGDHAEAIKWIRRGAEAASEAEADDRALELAKAAADLATMIVRMSHAEPPRAAHVPQIVPQAGGTGAPAAPSAPNAPNAPNAYAPAGSLGASGGLAGAGAAQGGASTNAKLPANRSAPRTVTSSGGGAPVTTKSASPGGGAGAATGASGASGARTSSAAPGPRPLQAARGPERAQSTGKGVLSPNANTRIETKRRRSGANLEPEARLASRVERLERVERHERHEREAPREDHPHHARVPREAEVHRTHVDADEASAPHGEADHGPGPTSEDAQTNADQPHSQRFHNEDLNKTSESDVVQVPRRASQAPSQPPGGNGGARARKRRSRTNEDGAQGPAAAQPAQNGRAALADEWDAQPTQALSRSELDSITNEHGPRMLPPRTPKDLMPLPEYARREDASAEDDPADSDEPSTQGRHASHLQAAHAPHRDPEHTPPHESVHPPEYEAQARPPSQRPDRQDRRHPSDVRHPSDMRQPAIPIIASQAVRVLLWRDSEGVHVAPAGTVVSAITIDAMLVALDPGADLSAWLDPRQPASIRPGRPK